MLGELGLSERGGEGKRSLQPAEPPSMQLTTEHGTASGGHLGSTQRRRCTPAEKLLMRHYRLEESRHASHGTEVRAPFTSRGESHPQEQLMTGARRPLLLRRVSR